MSATPLEQLIDALQAAILAAQALDHHVRDLADESRSMVEAVKQTGRCAHLLHTEKGGA